VANSSFGIRTRSGQLSSIIQSSAFDSDAYAFINAAGLSDATQVSAVNTLVVALKNNSLWTKMIAIYPIVGGTSTTHKFNLKNPADTNAAFRLTFSGGLTHSSNGILGGGVNGYIETNLAPSTSLELNNTHFSFYSRTNNALNSYEVSSGNANALVLTTRYTGNALYFAVNNNENNVATSSDGSGYFIGSRTASNALALYRNNSTTFSGTTASTSLTTNTVKYLSLNGSTNFSTKQVAFATIGSGLTSGEASTLYTIVQAYQTTLGRQV
jgi:hypothetical protein